ncbi:6-hydroxynicotinate 3-monooxygenase [Beauveria bassiana]|uniref:6-hydroxynicotinate 3-monooxygenase n=1 Tax=Beauveria bassiana TaxID=176275 RepID=A0A2N6NQM5_BEABA|nr:6-hydroxynicotinate 3-monooxygenase [Beauveria bassiana]
MLHIVIAGAGIAGLAAAVSLRRAGHHVQLYEQSSLNNEIGAAITIPPNASRILLAWGVRPQDWGFVLAEGASGYDPFTMEKTMDFGSKGSAEAIGGAPMYLSHRVDLHNCLKWLATREQGPGVPAKIHRRSNVAAFFKDPEAPSITLRNGQVIHADLIVGADGVHSRAAEAVLQHKIEAIAPQHSNICYRFLIPASVLEEDPETRHWNIANRSRTRVFSHNDTQRRLVTNTVHNFVGLIYDESARLDAEDWQASVKVDEIVDRFKDFHPDIVKVIRKAKDVKRWPLLYRYPLKTWHKDMLVLVGDAAHPMLPHQGQGGAQSIEDGLVLGISMLGARSRNDIESRFGIYQDVRRDRASVIQILSNIGQDLVQQLQNEVLPYLDKDKIPTNPAQIQQFNFGYDAIQAALEAMRRHEPEFSLPANFFDEKVVGVPPKTVLAVHRTGASLPHCGSATTDTGRAAVEIS